MIVAVHGQCLIIFLIVLSTMPGDVYEYSSKMPKSIAFG